MRLGGYTGMLWGRRQYQRRFALMHAHTGASSSTKDEKPSGWPCICGRSPSSSVAAAHSVAMALHHPGSGPLPRPLQQGTLNGAWRWMARGGILRVAGLILFILVSGFVAMTGNIPYWGQSMFSPEPGVSSLPSVGVIDREAVWQAHPSYPELLRVEAQIRHKQEDYVQYLQLLAKQAEVDGIYSPVLEEVLSGAAMTDAGTLAQQQARLQEELNEREKEIWSEVEKAVAERKKELRREVEAAVAKKKKELEQKVAQKVKEINRKYQGQILDLEVELALLDLKQEEAEKILNEMAVLQQEAEDKLEAVNEWATSELQSYATEQDRAARRRLQAYAEKLMGQAEQRLIRIKDVLEAKLAGAQENMLQVKTEQEDQWAGIWDDSPYRLDISPIDPVRDNLQEAQKALAEDMAPLIKRQKELSSQIESDVAECIKQAATASGVRLVVDKSSVETDGKDLTNQVLDILKGRA